MRSGKAPGPDHIPTGVVKLVVEEFPHFLVNFGFFPKECKTAKFFKLQNKPTFLLDFLGQLIMTPLKNELEEQDNLSDRQFGVRREWSTIQAMQKPN